MMDDKERLVDAMVAADQEYGRQGRGGWHAISRARLRNLLDAAILEAKAMREEARVDAARKKGKVA